MALDNTLLERHGGELCDALVARSTVANLRDRIDGITIVDAYHIQARMVARRVAAGETIVGKKIGVTSKAIQDAIGVFEPDFGQLTSGMAYEDGATVDLDALIQPKAEAERSEEHTSELQS